MASYTSWPTGTDPEEHVNLNLRYMKLRNFETIQLSLATNLQQHFFSDKKA